MNKTKKAQLNLFTNLNNKVKIRVPHNPFHEISVSSNCINTRVGVGDHGFRVLKLKLFGDVTLKRVQIFTKAR
jgi:hypothetical protein